MCAVGSTSLCGEGGRVRLRVWWMSCVQSACLEARCCKCCGLVRSGDTMVCSTRVRARFCCGAGLAGCEAVRLRVHGSTWAAGGFVWRCVVTLPGFLPAGFGTLCGLCRVRPCRMMGLGNRVVLGRRCSAVGSIPPPCLNHWWWNHSAVGILSVRQIRGKGKSGSKTARPGGTGQVHSRLRSRSGHGTPHGTSRT